MDPYPVAEELLAPVLQMAMPRAGGIPASLRCYVGDGKSVRYLLISCYAVL